MFRTLALSVLCVATVTGCATQSVTQTGDFYHRQALESGRITSGACDSVGQTIPTTPQYLVAIADATERINLARAQTAGTRDAQAAAEESR